MTIRDSLAAIVDRLKAIEVIFKQHTEAINAQKECDERLKNSQQFVRAEVHFDDKSIAAQQSQANEQNSIQRSIRRTALFALAAAVVYAGISYFQLSAMRTQTAQVFHQSEIENANASGQTAQLFRQLNIAQEQANAAKEGVDAIRRQMRVDQRAWLEFESQPDTEGGNKTTFQITSGQPVSYPLRVVNVGKTPARNIVMKIFVDVISASREPPLNRVANAKIGSPYPFGFITAGIVFPNTDFTQAVYRLMKGGAPLVATSTEVRAISDGTAYFAIYGIISYDDIFKVHHWTKFCRWEATNGTFATSQCTQFNSVDNNE